MHRVIVEELDSRGRVTERHVFDRPSVTIGRDYGCDMLVSDVYFGPCQFVVSLHEHGATLTNRDTTNALLVDGARQDSPAVPLRGGETVALGRTRLRFFWPGIPVPATRRMPATPTRGASRLMIAYSWLSLLLPVGFYTLNGWLRIQNEARIGGLISEALAPAVGALCWAAVWAFVSRLLRHTPNFYRQLVFSCIAVVLLQLIQTAGEYVEFASNSPAARTVFLYAANCAFLAAVLHFHLRISTRLTPRATAIAAAAVVVSSAGFVLFTSTVGSEYRSHARRTSTVIKPVPVLLRRPLSVEEFFAENGALVERIEKARERRLEQEHNP